MNSLLTNPQGFIGSFVVVLMLPFELFVLFLILLMAKFFRDSRAIKRWPTCSGRIVSSKVDSYRGYSRKRHRTMYRPRIHYEYTVDGQTYTGGSLSIDGISSASFPSWAQNIVDRYPAGCEVQVFYNPAKPDEAVLERSTFSWSGFLLLVMVGVEVLLITISVRALRGQL